MKHLNIEIKARCENHQNIRKILRTKNALFKGTDHQIDTYFNIAKGRLKLRDGTIENSLIYYQRSNLAGPKQSRIILYKSPTPLILKEILKHALGVLVVVDKKREIYFIGNVKIHLDTLKNLGTFVEIEAIDEKGTIGKKKLLAQCNKFIKLFGIKNKDMISCSYSDLLI